jgi:hypothetical protein
MSECNSSSRVECLFDFVPSRGSPEDNKVWLTLTFSSSRRGGDQNKFETLTLEKFVGLWQVWTSVASRQQQQQQRVMLTSLF